jgi:hypothetical protein
VQHIEIKENQAVLIITSSPSSSTLSPSLSPSLSHTHTLSLSLSLSLIQVLGHMQRTDVTRPRELLHAPTLQEMLEMDSEIDGGRCPHHAMMVLCCAVLPASSGGKEVVVCWRGFTSHDLRAVWSNLASISVIRCNTSEHCIIAQVSLDQGCAVQSNTQKCRV